MQKLTRGILWALAATSLASCGDDRIGRENGNDLAVADAVSADAVSDAIIVAIADEGLPPDNEDAGAADVPDLGDPPDPPPDLGLTDGAHLCEPADASADPPPPPTLENTTPLPPIEMGGPAAVDQLFLNNLDGDPAGTPEVVVIRGGRVLAARPDGRLLWQSAPFSARFLSDLTDLNGDGRPEVVARSARDVRVFDALTGVLRWQLPALAFGDDQPPLIGIHRLILADVDVNGIVDVQVSDGGCGSSDGTGSTAIFGFAGARPEPMTGAWMGESRLAVVPSPSRCARWQNLADFDADGRLDLAMPTRTGIVLADPLTGATLACIDGLPEFNTQALNRAVDLDRASAEPDAQPELVVFTQRQVLALELSDAPAEAPCPAGTRALSVRWAHPLAAARGERAAFLRAPFGETATRVAVSAWDEPTGQWITTLVDGETGEIDATLPDTLLAGPAELDGAADSADVLVFLGASRTPEAFGRLQALSFDAAPGVATLLWEKTDAAPLLRRHPALEADRPPDFRDALTLEGRALIVRWDAVTRAAERLESVGPDGAVHALDLEGEPVGADADCGAMCRAAVSLNDGRIALLDTTLTVLNADAGGRRPALLAPTGTATVMAVDGLPEGAGAALIATSTTGHLGRLVPVSGPATWLWSTPLGNGDGSGRPVPLAVPGTLGSIARRDFRRPGAVSWAFFDVETGARQGQHDLDTDSFVSLGEALAADVNGDARADLLRFDRALALSDPDPECPARDVQARVVTAVDGRTREVLWQTPIRPSDPCRSPSAERLSVVLNAAGAPSVFVTESNTIRRLDVATGEESAFAELDDLPGAMRSGGSILATGLPDVPFLRVGGNGPIEARDAALGLLWRAADDLAVGNRSWRDRPAIVVGRQVWLSPAPGAPIVMLGLDGPMAGGVEGTIRLGGGQELAADAPGQADVGGFLAVAGLSAQVDRGVLVHADDGYLYALDERGALVFARAFADSPGRAVVADIDADGVVELVNAVSDGTVVVADNAGVGPPSLAWDLPCPPDPQCDPSTDIDRTTNRTQLCVEWYPTPEAEGYLVRAVGPNGAPVSAWQEVGTRPVTRINDLELLPGSLYCVEVRAWRQPGPQIELSPPVMTDCVLVVDETPPTVTLTVSDPTYAPGDPPMGLELVAHDDEGLSSWRIELYTPLGIPLGVLFSGAAQGSDWTVVRELAGRDALGKAIPPGAFELRAFAQDQAGAEASASALITLCGEPCP